MYALIENYSERPFMYDTDLVYLDGKALFLEGDTVTLFYEVGEVIEALIERFDFYNKSCSKYYVEVPDSALFTMSMHIHAKDGLNDGEDLDFWVYLTVKKVDTHEPFIVN